MPTEALPIPHEIQRRMREDARLNARLGATGRDITVTWGPVTSRTLQATITPGA